LEPTRTAGRARRLRRPFVVLALAAMLAALAGCGGDEGGDGGAAGGKDGVDVASVKGGPLTVWLGGILATATPGSPARKWYDAQVAEFEQKHPGTEVETVLMNPDAFKQTGAFRAAFGAREVPDVAMMYPGSWAMTFASSLQNLRETIPEAVGRFKELQLAYGCEDFDCSNDAPVYLLPYDFSNWVFAYNKEIFAKVGIEAPFESWDAMVEAGRKLKAAGYTPFQIGNRDGYFASAYLAPMYSSYFEPQDVSKVQKGEIPLTDERFIEPLRIWSELYSEGLTNENACTLEHLASQRDFFAGKAATIASYEYSHLYKEMGDKVGVMPWPKIESGPHADKAGTVAQVGEGWVIPKGAADLDLAAAFVDFITDAPAQSAAFKIIGTPPANPEAGALDPPDPVSGASAELFAQFTLLPMHNGLPLKTQEAYFKETAQAFCGRKTPEQAMQAIQDQFEQEKR
jgi:raffinose/stachyose/melibiose transport system substrate-binding protein